MVYCVLCGVCVFFFFKQKTAYEMRISDWSSDVCSSDLGGLVAASFPDRHQVMARTSYVVALGSNRRGRHGSPRAEIAAALTAIGGVTAVSPIMTTPPPGPSIRSEERRVGKECVRTGRSWWSPDHEKKNKKTIVNKNT